MEAKGFAPVLILFEDTSGTMGPEARAQFERVRRAACAACPDNYKEFLIASGKGVAWADSIEGGSGEPEPFDDEKWDRLGSRSRSGGRPRLCDALAQAVGDFGGWDAERVAQIWVCSDFDSAASRLESWGSRIAGGVVAAALDDGDAAAARAEVWARNLAGQNPGVAKAEASTLSALEAEGVRKALFEAGASGQASRRFGL